MRNLSVDLLGDVAALREEVAPLSSHEDILAGRAEEALGDLVAALNARLTLHHCAA